MTKFDPDKLASMNPERAGTAAMTALDRLQNFPAEQQLAGAALMFVTLLRRHNQHAGNVLTVANNMMEQASAKYPALGAVRDYMRHET